MPHNTGHFFIFREMRGNQKEDVENNQKVAKNNNLAIFELLPRFGPGIWKRGYLMIESSIYRLQRILKESNIELIFSGAFSQSLIEELGEALKQRLLNQQVTKSKISSAFFAFVEQTQNIRNYLIAKEGSDDYNMLAKSGVIAISQTGLGYCITSGNIIFNEDVERLQGKLDIILSMDLEALNDYYRKILRDELDKEYGRAGLGLVQIARKAAGPIEYQIEKIDDKYSFYTLTVVV